MAILDLDLMSCQSAIVLGLSPKHLQALQSTIEGQGLWPSIDAQMQADAQSAAYHQPAVKVATHDSLLLKDKPSVINSLFDNLRREHGVTESELRKSAYYEPYRRCFEDIVDALMSSSVIKDMREVSQHIKDTYHNKYLQTPTGHHSLVNDVSFQTAYANYLHSHEFSLLAQATCETLEAFPTAQLIGHYHDGNVVMVPLDERSQLLDLIGERVKQIRDRLGLRYPQRIECKRSYGEQ